MIKFLKRFFNKKPEIDHEEQRKWDEFQASCAQRKEKHKINLHKSATGCRAGLRWTEDEDIKVINALHPGVTLMELSELTGRPIYGISSRIRDNYRLWTNDCWYQVCPTSRVPRAVVYKMPVKVLEALLKKGWKEDDYRNLHAPSWFRNIHEIRKGR